MRAAPQPAEAPRASPRVIIVMGAAGCGKSTVAAALAARLGGAFVEADALHTPAAIAQMRAGVPLTDADRAPWLDRVAERARETALAHRVPVCVACSALRREYRDRLRAGIGPDCDVVFVHLDIARSELAERIANRTDHFMPVALLDSQLATLEPLEEDERGITVDAALPAEQLVAGLAGEVSLGTPCPGARRR